MSDDIYKFRKIWREVKNDPSLKNTLDVNALLAKERDRHLGVGEGASPAAAAPPPEPERPLRPWTGPDLLTMNQENLAVLKSIRPALPKPILYEMHSKLTGFLHIEEIHELRMGRYTRWIRDDDQETLKSGGFLVDIKFTGTGTLLSVVPINAKHPFSLKYDCAIIFQKLTNDERMSAALSSQIP